MTNKAYFYDGGTPDSPDFDANILIFQLTGDSAARAGYAAAGVYLEPDGSAALGTNGPVLTSAGLTRSEVVEYTPDHVLDRADAGRIIEMAKARTSDQWSTTSLGGDGKTTVDLVETSMRGPSPFRARTTSSTPPQRPISPPPGRRAPRTA